MTKRTRSGLAAFLTVIGLGAFLGSLNSQWLGYPWAFVADGVVLLVGIVSWAWETR